MLSPNLSRPHFEGAHQKMNFITCVREVDLLPSTQPLSSLKSRKLQCYAIGGKLLLVTCIFLK